MLLKEKFVLFPLGRKRFALPAGRVHELARPGDLHSFPHTTALLGGVLVRRGRMLPVCDVAAALVPAERVGRKCYLIAARGGEWTAIPVSGECELIEAQMIPPTGRLPEHVTGLLSLPEEIFEVLELDRIAAEVSA